MTPNLYCKSRGSPYFGRKECDKSCPHIVGDRSLRNSLKRRNEESQDTWIFSTPFPHYKHFKCDYPLGRAGCDSLLNYNIVNYAIKHQELVISNPCLTIQCVHIDKLGTREDRLSSWKKTGIKIDRETYPNLGSYCKVPWVELGDMTTYSR
jgi:hypothetical protein